MVLDPETKKLDSEIMAFIRTYATKEAPDAVFQALALKVFDYQFRRNVLYRRFCLIQGKKPGRVGSWKGIPAMPAVGFKELVLTTFPPKRAVRVFKTSGTSATKASADGHRGAHFFDTLKLYEAALKSPFKRFLLPGTPKAKMFFLISPPKEAPDSSLSFMMGVVGRSFGEGGGKFYIKKGKFFFKELTADLRSARSPVLLLATALALKGFLDVLKREKIRLKLPHGSRLMETGGFKAASRVVSKGALYAECRKYLGIPTDLCVGEYGMTELSSQFYARGPRGVFQGPAWTRTLVVNPLTGREVLKGQKGVLKHFDLANRGSVIAIQTQDVGRARDGGGFELLGRAKGAERRGCSLKYEEFIRQ